MRKTLATLILSVFLILSAGPLFAETKAPEEAAAPSEETAGTDPIEPVHQEVIQSYNGTEKSDSTLHLKVPFVITPTKTEKSLAKTTMPITVITKEEMAQRKDFQLVDALRHVPGLTVVQSGPRGRQTSLFLRGANSDQVLFMINGVRMNSPTTGIPDNVAHMSVESIERVEVVRGPQAVQYGSDALAGVINVITKKGEGKPHLETGFEYGTQETFKEYATLSGSTDRVNYFGSFSRIDSRDWIASRRVEDDGYQNWDANTQLGIQLLDNVKLESFYQHVSGQVGIDYGPFDQDQNAWEKNRQNIVGTTLTADVFKWWQQIFKFTYNHNDYAMQDPAEPETNAPKNFWDSVLPFHLDTEIYDFEAQSNFTLAEWNILTTGVEYEFQKASNRSEQYDWNLFQFVDGSFRNHVRNTSWYIQDQMSFFDRLDVVGGVRVLNSNSFQTHADPQVSASYRHKETGTTARGNFGTAFKQPSLNELYYVGSGNPDLFPEKTTAYDVGLEQEIEQIHTVLGFDYFHQSYRGVIQPVFDPVTFGWPSQNTGKAYIDGFEFETKFGPWKDFTARAFTNLLYTRDKNRNKEELVRRPRWSGGAEINYKFWERWNANSSLVWSGSRKDWGREFTIQDNRGYLKWDMTLAYDITKYLQVYGRVENLTNDHYEEARGYEAPGFMAFVGVTLNFDLFNPLTALSKPAKAGADRS